MSETEKTVDQESTTATGQDTPKQFDEAYVKSLRDEAAKYRTERNEFKTQVEGLSQKVNKLGELESLIKKQFGEQEDPETLINTLKQENHNLKLQQTFSRVSKALNADEELTYATLQAKGKLSAIDPSDEKALSELVTKALETNPKLKAVAPTKTGDNGSETPDTGGFDFNKFLRTKGRM